MLSENNNINLGNYEEYFILYMDNELNAAEKLMVETFLSAHPDLQSEMDVLLSTKLPLADLNFSGKEELMSLKMKMEAADESLLLYIDGEASAAEKNKVEYQLKTDKSYQLEYGLLVRAKLDASDIIYYPNKKELYRRTEKVVAIRLWMKIAAAIVVILFATLLLLLNSGNSKTPAVVAHNNPVRKQNTLPVKKEETLAPVIHKAESIALQSRVKKEPVPVKDVDIPKKNQQQDEIVQNNIPDKAPKKSKVDLIEITKTGNTITLKNPVLNNSIPTPDVTSSNTTAYNMQEGSQENADEEPKNNKGTFKGFLRKAARVIERRTGIGAENENNEVLIGAVAVKLK